jgi:hypothetical protein
MRPVASAPSLELCRWPPYHMGRGRQQDLRKGWKGHEMEPPGHLPGVSTLGEAARGHLGTLTEACRVTWKLSPWMKGHWRKRGESIRVLSGVGGHRDRVGRGPRS